MECNYLIYNTNRVKVKDRGILSWKLRWSLDKKLGRPKVRSQQSLMKQLTKTDLKLGVGGQLLQKFSWPLT